MTRLLLLFVFVFAFATLPAHADEIEAPSAMPETLTITPPTGWSMLPGLSKSVAQSTSESDLFGVDEAFQSGALAHARANLGALYLTWATSVRTQAVPETTIRHAFDDLHSAPALANSKAGATDEVLYRERSYDGIVEMRFEWVHIGNDTMNLERALAWKDEDALVHLVSAKCVLARATITESRPKCQTALDSLHLTEHSVRSPLRALPAPSMVQQEEPEDFVVPELKTGDVVPGASLGEAPTQRGEVLYQGPPKPESDSNNRIIIAIGILLLGVAFWLTTRSGPSATSEETMESEEDEEEIEE